MPMANIIYIDAFVVKGESKKQRLREHYRMLLTAGTSDL
jgi:hypothetical protein